MSLVPSLLQAIVQLDGEALVMHVGEKPYVVSPTGQVDLATRGLGLDAVVGIVNQLMPPESQRSLDEFGAAQYELPPIPEFPGERFTIVVARGGDDVWAEIRRRRIIDDDRVSMEMFAPSDAAAVTQISQAPIGPGTDQGGDLGADLKTDGLYEPRPVESAGYVPPAATDAADDLQIPDVNQLFGDRTQAGIKAPVDDFALKPAPTAPAPQPVQAASAPVPPAPAPQVIQAVSSPAPAWPRPAPAPAFQAATPPPPPAPAPQPVQAAPVSAPPAPAPQVVQAASSSPSAPAWSWPPPEPAFQAAAPPPPPAPAPQPVQAAPVSAPPAPAPQVVQAASSSPSAPAWQWPAPAPAFQAAALPPPPAPSPQPFQAASVPPPPVFPAADEAWQPPPPLPQLAAVLPLARSPIRPDTPPPLAAHAFSGLDQLLRLAAARGASALYLSSAARPSVRVDGEVYAVDGAPILGPNDVESLLLALMPERNAEALRTGVASEWISDLPDVGRVRCLSFRDHRGPGGVFRMMPVRAVTSEQLGLSREIQALAIEPEGLVLVAGPRSSGKRTLMSALVDLINRTRRDHVITIETETNMVHERNGSFISQREVRGGSDEMVAVARAALREDPDVLVLEELRTAALMTLALDAAGAGQLVIGGFPAHNATGAVDRIIDLYPPEYRRQVQLSLAQNLRGVVAQVLLRKTTGGRVAARELLLNTPAVASVLAEGKTSQLPLAIEGGRRQGMVPLNDALVGYVQAGTVDVREAYRRAADRAGFLALLKRQGVDTSLIERYA